MVFFTSTSAVATGLASLDELASSKEEFSGFASANLGSTPLLLIFPSISVGFVAAFSGLFPDNAGGSWGWDGRSTCFAEETEIEILINIFQAHLLPVLITVSPGPLSLQKDLEQTQYWISAWRT